MVSSDSKSGMKPVRAAIRPGTATRRAGRETASRIVRAAQKLLCQTEYSAFTMRAVAVHAGVSLANLQYYFPNRTDLVQAVFEDIGKRYAVSYEAMVAGRSLEPREHFGAVLRWNLEDILRRETRQLFIRLWELVGSIDKFSGRLLGAMYLIDIEQLAECIRAMHPDEKAGELRLRATLVAAMIEGLMVVQGDPSDNKAGARRLMQRALKQGFAIADGDGAL